MPQPIYDLSPDQRQLEQLIQDVSTIRHDLMDAALADDSVQYRKQRGYYRHACAALATFIIQHRGDVFVREQPEPQGNGRRSKPDLAPLVSPTTGMYDQVRDEMKRRHEYPTLDEYADRDLDSSCGE